MRVEAVQKIEVEFGLKDPVAGVGDGLHALEIL